MKLLIRFVYQGILAELPPQSICFREKRRDKKSESVTLEDGWIPSIQVDSSRFKSIQVD
jgi:hypothetical protein